MRQVIVIILLVILSSAYQFVNAQTNSDTSLVRVETIDGNEFTGEIVGLDSLKIYLKTHNLGEIGILKSDIKSQQKIKVQQIKDGKVWFENPQSSRYFWAPNAYGLKKGEGYYQNIWVMWNQVSYGITDNLRLLRFSFYLKYLFLFRKINSISVQVLLWVPFWGNQKRLLEFYMEIQPLVRETTT